MKKIFKKYRNLILLILGIILCLKFICFILIISYKVLLDKNYGSLAEWVSGIGSIGAIMFAYWQIYNQKEEADKKEDLTYRPYFVISTVSYFKRTKHILVNIKYTVTKKIEDLLVRGNTYDKDISIVDGYVLYKLHNVSNASAINVFLKIYYDNSEDSKDSEIIYTNYIKSDSYNLIATGKMIKDAKNIKKSSNSKYKFSDVEKIEVYFSSLNNKCYMQCWDEKNNGGLEIDKSRIKQIAETKMPETDDGYEYESFEKFPLE